MDGKELSTRDINFHIFTLVLLIGQFLLPIKMSRRVPSLYTICLNPASWNLMKCRRKSGASTSYNPFKACFPYVVHDLISNVCLLTESQGEFLKSEHLSLLLSSGRVSYLKIDDMKMLLEDADNIFNDLQPHIKKLETIKIRNTTCIDSPWTSSNFGNLLRSAENLVCIETDINFELSDLSNCVNLEKLFLIDYDITGSLSSFLRVGDEIRYNHSLKILRISLRQTNPNFYLEIAEILQYCVEIIEIHYEIAQSLVYLHENKKATTYKLRETQLGENEEPLFFRVTKEMIQIASLYCPDLRSVEVSPVDYHAFDALRNFRRITHLIVKEPLLVDFDFTFGICPLIEIARFGHNLRSLVIIYFSEIDFALIGTCCPNLEELKVKYISERNSEFAADSFRKLISLYLKTVTDEPCAADSLIGIISRASNLEFLTIKNAEMFNDIVLNEILKNSEVFSRLHSLTVEKCGLTIEGLEKLAQAMDSADYVFYGSDIISVEESEKVLSTLDLDIFETPE